MTHSRRTMRSRSATVILSATLAAGGLVSIIGASPVAAQSAQFNWSPIANVSDTPAGSSLAFNSFNQPSVNDSGVVVFRARTKGSQPLRGIYTRNTQGAGQPIATVAQVGDDVPAPNNSGGTFNEFPSFPQIDISSSRVVTRGQSTPVWTYSLNGSDTKVGTSGLYTTASGPLTTGASLLGNVPGQEVYSVPGATAGTRFDQFPGAPGISGNVITFKGNYTEGTSGMTGVFYRDLSQATNPVELIANSSTVIPGQGAGGTVVFGATAPPSAANGQAVFTGWDNEDNPTVGGIYLADLTPNPALTPLASIGDTVPGQGGATFTNFGEGLSFDGRFVAFWASWGTTTTTMRLTCPTDGNADLIAYCLSAYPDGYSATIPAHQGIFVYDTVAHSLNTVTTTGARYADFEYWVFSGSPPGVGGGDTSRELPRWRVSAFAAVSGLSAGAYQVAFKATTVYGDTGIYVGQGPSAQERIITAVQTSEVASTIDSASPAGTLVSSVGLERGGFRGRYLAVAVSMLDPTATLSWAGIYVTTVPSNLAVESQAITFNAPPPAHPGDHFTLDARTDSGLPVAYTIDATSGAGVCSLSGSVLTYEQFGTCIVDANQAGDAAYSAAAQVQQTIEVVKRPQAITAPAVPPAYIGASHNFAATSDSGLPVAYTIDATSQAGVCSLSGSVVSYLQLGSCVVDLNQTGDATYAAATQVQVPITVTLHPQQISVTAPSTVYLGGTFNLHATSDSGLPVAYTIDATSGAGVCSLSGSVVRFLASGTCVINVAQAGDPVYAPASTVQVVFSVVIAPVSIPTPTLPQVITVPPPPTVTYGDSYILDATADSGLPVTYAIDSTSTAGTCSLVDSTLHFDGVGSCVVSVSQEGDPTFMPAPSVLQTIVVSAIGATVKVTTTVSRASFGQAARAKATVSMPKGDSTGTVQFLVDGRALGEPRPLVNGVALSSPLIGSNQRPLNVGTHKIEAVFTPEDVAHFSTVRSSVAHVVQRAATKVTFVVRAGVLTAKVLPSVRGAVKVSGRVVFKVAGKVIGRAVLRNQVATLHRNLSGINVGRASARYVGNSSFRAATSSRVVVRI